MWGKKKHENYVAMLGHTMQKIALHCKLICSQIDKTVNSTNLSECFCAARKNSIRGDKIAARNNNVFCFWVCGLKLVLLPADFAAIAHNIIVISEIF